MEAPLKTSSPASSESDRFRLFISSVTDYAIYTLTPEGYISTWNAGAQRFKAYTEDEIIGQHFSRFYTDEDQAAGIPAKALQTALDNGKFEDEGWRVRKDGSRFWASVVIDPIYDKQGQLLGFAKITRDITERKQNQEALRASEERFKLLVQSVTDYAIYMLSLSGTITNWNAGAQRIKGYAQEEVIGTHFSRFYTEEERAKGLPMISLERAAKEGHFESEGLRVRKDGTKFWANVVIDAIFNEQGEMIGFAKITRDITERRNAAIAIERAKEALFQSQKLEAIGKLTGGIAHDFNNFLSVIVTGIELLSKEVQSSSGARILDSMQRAASRGASLTQQLLSFARQQPLRPQQCNLSRVLGSFEAVLRRVCNESIIFNMALDPMLKSVLADTTQFEAALLNLVTNARDAMPTGGKLTIATENALLGSGQIGALPPGQYVRVTVKDTGTGMSADIVSHAVEPFFTTKERGKGTGMGLSQVYGLVQQCGGDMLLETMVGEGTSISLYLPALADDVEMGGAEKPAVNDRVLLVDDQADVLDVAVELFRDMGYDVLSANNGEDALEMLKRTPDVDVLFSDVAMPGISGITLGQEARKIVPGIKIILTSGYPAPAMSGGNSNLHDFNFIKKPYRVAEIIKMLRKAD